mmetsp:Transcript_23031/g.54612  ORF Transcript_23031/g.54612 Transcript_23031/m.54612 type:complete len:121 (+) Transcript_23031:120-482(+)
MTVRSWSERALHTERRPIANVHRVFSSKTRRNQINILLRSSPIHNHGVTKIRPLHAQKITIPPFLAEKKDPKIIYRAFFALQGACMLNTGTNLLISSFCCCRMHSEIQTRLRISCSFSLT